VGIVKEQRLEIKETDAKILSAGTASCVSYSQGFLISWRSELSVSNQEACTHLRKDTPQISLYTAASIVIRL
jgi:hypothetical protein